MFGVISADESFVGGKTKIRYRINGSFREYPHIRKRTQKEMRKSFGHWELDLE